tara:strand:- start:10868 stop:11491 length:624 start_codon:yes stop_codon:yes gene_type:complete
MDLREEAKAKDDIIKYLLNNQMHHDQPKMFRPSDFCTLVFDKKLNTDDVEMLVQEIFDHPDNVVKNVQDMFIGINGKTQTFYDSGGFVGIYDQEQRDVKATKDAELVTRKKDREQLTILKWQKNTFWIVFALGLVGGVYSLYKISQAIFNPPNNVTEEQLSPKIESIHNRLEQLEKGLKQKDKEVDQLREELNKAEMMVRVLEETKP